MDSSETGLDNKCKRFEFSATFYASVIGFVLFYKQIATFPAIVVANGGGAFFIPYCLSLIGIVVPAAYMEMTMGQLTGKGPIRIWEELSPIFKGLGYAKMMMLLFGCIQTAPTIAYAIFYLFWGLAPSGDILPWNTCINNWNNQTLCRTIITPCNPLEPYNASGTTLPTLPAQACVNPGQFVTTPENEYFMNNVLQYTPQYIYSGPVVQPLVASLAIVWGFSFLIICTGFRVYRRVAILVNIVVISLIFVLQGFSSAFEGTTTGYNFVSSSLYFRLRDFNVWYLGFREAFYTYAISSGCFVYLGSRNKVFSMGSNFGPIAVSVLIASLYSVACSYVVYGYLGLIAAQRRRPIESLAASGNQLMFVTLPMMTRTAVVDVRLKLALSVFYSLYTVLGISTLAIMLETVVTAVVEDLPKVVHRFKILFRILFHLIVFALGILTVRTGSPGVIDGMQKTLDLVQPFLAVFQYFAFVFVFGRCLVPEIYHNKLPPRGWSKGWLAISCIVLACMVGALIYHCIRFIPSLVSTSDTFLLALSWTMFALAMLIILGTTTYKAIKHSNNIIRILTPSENLNIRVQEVEKSKLSSKAVQYFTNTAGGTTETMLEQF